MEQQPGHVIPKKTLILTYFTLIFLTAVMVGLSRLHIEKDTLDWVDLHAVRSVVIMSVALIMGVIVALVLMGLKYEHKAMNATILISNFVFLLIFVLFTWADTSFRGEVDPAFAEKINWESPVKADTAGKAHGSEPPH